MSTGTTQKVGSGNKNPSKAQQTPAQTAASNKPSAAPGTTDPAGQKPEKVVRVLYPGLYSDTEKDDKGRPKQISKLDSVPADFNPKIHLPLQRRDFKDESVYFQLRADIAKKSAERFQKLADDAKKLGGMKERVKAKKLLQMQKRMADLIAELKAGGTNVDELLANPPADEDAAEKTAVTA